MRRGRRPSKQAGYDPEQVLKELQDELRKEGALYVGLPSHCAARPAGIAARRAPFLPAQRMSP